MSSPELQLDTLYLRDADGRIISTREPHASRGPFFALIRGFEESAWAVHRDVPDEVAAGLDRLAREEPVLRDARDPPRYALQYRGYLGSRMWSGPAFTFPERLDPPGGVVPVRDVRLLQRHFSGWVSDELPGREPIFAVVRDGYPVSVCFCARRSPKAAEAGLETAADYRGRGFGPMVAAAWAEAVRESGRVPLYSTSWANAASLAVTRKLGLTMYAVDWNLAD